MPYKIMNDEVEINRNKFVELNPHSSSGENNAQSLQITCMYIHNFHKTLSSHGLQDPGSRYWNNLPENIVSAASVDVATPRSPVNQPYPF